MANGGFETPALAAGSFLYEGGTTTGSWTYGGSAAISANGSGFTGGNPPAPQGVQVAVLQETGSASQVVGGFTAGQYDTVSFSAAQRAGYPPSSVMVTLNEAFARDVHAERHGLSGRDDGTVLARLRQPHADVHGPGPEWRRSDGLHR